MIKNSGRASVAGLYVFASVSAAALTLPAVIVLTRLARIVCLLVPALEGMLRSPRLFDSAAFAFSGALSALAQYYLGSLLALYRADKRFHYACVFCAALACGWFFHWITGRSRLGLYPLCWLPTVIGALLGAIAALRQEEEHNPWPYDLARYFPGN